MLGGGGGSGKEGEEGLSVVPGVVSRNQERNEEMLIWTG